MLIDVFVTYSWEEERNQLVYSFVNFLRQNGFNATCDINSLDEESTVNFSKIMSDGLKSSKVIIILSRSYKTKAESGKGGVGQEYRIISQDLNDSKSKYILVSFDGTSEDVRKETVPKLYEGYSILDLKTDEANSFKQLFAKLRGTPSVFFSPVAKNITNIYPEDLPKFTLKKSANVCRGYGPFTDLCASQILNPQKTLCKDCYEMQYKDKIIELFKFQNYIISQSNYDYSVFIAKLRYGITTIVCLVKTFAYYDGNLDPNEMSQLNDIKCKEMENEHIDKVYIITKRTINNSIRNIAKNLNFIIKTENELIHKIMDLSDYFSNIINIYEKSDLKEHYIELSNTEGDLLSDIMDEFITQKEYKGLLFLGDYGCGKTSFCLKTTYKLIKDYQNNKSPYIPIFIYLRDYSKAISMEELITNFLINQHHINNGNIQTFKLLLKYGNVVLIFDGFDEIAKRVEYDIKYQVYNEICKFAYANTKIVLTCRPNFFQDQREYEQLFKSSYLHYEPSHVNDIDFKRVNIAEFSPKQSVQFIKSYSNQIESSGISMKDFYKVYDTTHDLNDLAKRPFLLGIIVQTLPQLIIELAKSNTSEYLGLKQNNTSLKINAADLYDKYTRIWLDRENKKGKTLIKSTEKILFCENLAYEMFISNDYSVHYSKLPKIIKDHFSYLTNISEIDYFSHDIQSCSFLSSDGNGNFKYIHKSFMEYFVARLIFHKLETIEKTETLEIEPEYQLLINNYLGKSYLTTEICFFFSDLLTASRRVTNSYLNYLEDCVSSVNEVAFKNIIAILSKTESEIGVLLNNLPTTKLHLTDLSYSKIENATISNLSFNHSSFYGALFYNVVFQNCLFNNCSFDNTVLKNVVFSSCSLDYIYLRNSFVENCDFSLCTMIECDLSGANIASSNFNRADLSGNIVSPKTKLYKCINLDTAYGAPY